MEIERNQKKYEEEMEKQLAVNKEKGNMEREWQSIRESIINTTEEIIGRERKRKKTKWFDEECGKAIRKKKREEWIDNEMKNMEKDKKSNIKLYQYIRKQSRKPNMTNIEGEEWEKHFKKLLVNEDLEEKEVWKSSTSSEEEQNPPTEEEFNEIIENLKRNKSPGLDEIVNEMIKNGGSSVRHRLYSLIVEV